jgi:hypothetical protein
VGCGGSQGDDPRVGAHARPPDSLPPLAHPPLQPPLQITATFGEYRRGHFHAGLDFSTDMRVGWPVYAPLDGWVERVRTSGAGYGRMMSLRAADGRSVLFGHLDAFAEPLASWVAAVQDSTEEYEQDLHPASGRFPVQAGQQIAWSGESGAGPPHLHMEVRWGDMAYNPLRHGLQVPDSSAPVLNRVTLEPVDSESYVDRSAAPRSYSLGTPADTIVVQGSVRLWLDVMDGVSDPWPRVAPYAVRLETEREVVECRFDRVMWDDDMTAVEWVYDDHARAAPGRAIALWFAPDYRPMVFSLPERDGPAGVIRVLPGDPPRPIVVAALDASGNRAEARLLLRAPRPHELGPAIRVLRRTPRRRGFEIFPAASGHMRVAYGGAPAGTRAVSIGWEGSTPRAASFDGSRWSALLPVSNAPTALVASGEGGAAWQDRKAVQLVLLAPDQAAEVKVPGSGGARWSLPEGGVFSRSFVVFDSVSALPPMPGLAALGQGFAVGSERLPLRRAATVVLPLDGSRADRAGVYHEQNGGWSFAGGARRDDGRAVAAQVRVLGRYATYADVEPPRIGLARTRGHARSAPHARWSLQCGIVERGSGIDPAGTQFIVDGRRVPSEWEIERAVLRWRPLHPPPAGSHRYEVIATDVAGNVARASGSFAVR